MNEKTFDSYIRYIDKREKLFDKYHTNFDIVKIDNILKNYVKDFIK